jgi:ClpP class serine protease
VVALAGGRVWSGADAVERMLVDRLGGVEIARDEVLTRLRAKGERGALKLELLRGVRGDVPPADPTSPAAFVLERLAPDLGPLTALLGTRERALVIALDLPEVV